MKKIGMCQINTSFGNQEYFPYSIGLMQAYANKYLENINDFEFLLPIHKKIPIKEALVRYEEADVVFFSAYVWSFNLSCEIARRLKENNPETLIVFGGPHVPERSVKEFLIEHPFIDLACIGNGEIIVTEILRNFETKDWGKIDGVSFRAREAFNLSLENPRILDVNTIPSPYTSGVFDNLIKAYPETKWIVPWETNRGCPFSCAYCDWGSATNNKVCIFDMERLFAEIDWFSEKKIEFVTCCDSNFGMLERDYEIIKKFAENKDKYGYPENISVQSTKNLKEHSFNTYKLLSDRKLKSGISISLQTLNPETLGAIKRANLLPEFFQLAHRRLSAANVPTFTDLILSLPLETYDSFIQGITGVIENGQHTKIIFNDLSVLPNAEMGNVEYQKKYGFDIVDNKVVGRHETISDDENEIYETQRLVVATSTLSREDWVKAKTYSWFVSLLYFAKILQIPFVVLMKEYGIKFHEIVERFMNSESPAIKNMKELFRNKAIDMQNGGCDFIASKEWMNLWWPADEFAFVKLCTESSLGDFYLDAELLVYDLLQDKGFTLSDFTDTIRDTFILNKALVKLPFLYDDFKVKINHNIYEVYTAYVRGENIALVTTPTTYLVKASDTSWDSWEKWAEKVVWQEYKKGSYIYRCEACHG